MYLQKFDLTGRVSIVTGGGRNIGFACAEVLAEAGSHVVIAELDSDSGAAAVTDLKEKGHSAESVVLDVSKPADVTACADTLVARHGKVDILVANAGICLHAPGEEMPDAMWLKVIDINLNGVFWCNRAFGRHMLDAGKGSIVNVGSMSGMIANKPQQQCSYNASKAGVHMLTKSLATEWGSRGVRVNAVAPTYVETALTKTALEGTDWYETWMEMTPMHRWGQPPEIAALVLFLASDAASLMTGSVVVADAGYTSW